MNKKTKIKFNIIIVIAIILFAIATIPKTFQEDTYYLIKVGEYISQNGINVINERIEPFSWHEGMIYTYPHWLFDIILYFIYSIFDFTGIYALTVILGIIIYLIIYYTNIKVSKNNIISAIIAIASIYLLSGFITARAQIISYICFILEILFIERFLEKGKKRYIIGLILVPILLANCHAALFPIYFVIYLPYIAEYIISFFNKEKWYEIRIKVVNKKIEKLKLKENSKNVKKIELKEKKLIKLKNNLKIAKEVKDTKVSKIIIERNKNVKWLILTFIICIFTGLLTPIKDIPYTYMIKSIQGNTMHFIAEHQPVVLIHSINLLIVFAVIIICIFSNKVKIKLRDIFMLIGMSILSLIAYKQFPIFFICTMCIINKMINMLVSDDIKEKAKSIVQKILSIKGMIYCILIIIVMFLVQYKNIVGQNYVDSNEYPTLAATWLKNNVDVENMRLFNDFNYGSYLLFKDIPVFIDGRADAYDPVFNGKEDDVFLDYMQASSLQVWYDDVLKKYDITHIITKTNSNFNTYLQRNIEYKNIYNDGTFSIYEVRK